MFNIERFEFEELSHADSSDKISSGDAKKIEGDEVSKKIKLINIYTPNGNPVDTEKYSYKIYWLDSLIKKLKSYLKNNETCPFHK